MLGNFYVAVVVCCLFSKLTFFQKMLNRHTIVLLILIWDEIVCSGYQQTTKVAVNKRKGFIKLMISLLTFQQ